MRGGLLDAAAHDARDMVTSEEEVEEEGREKRTGAEVVVEKFFPVRVTGVSRVSESLVTVCARAGGGAASQNESTRAQRK